jgi:hypothetical protein
MFTFQSLVKRINQKKRNELFSSVSFVLFDKMMNKIDEIFYRNQWITNELELKFSNGLVFNFLCKNRCICM